jgi:hypothetical protein
MSTQGTFARITLGPGAVKPVIGEARNFHVVYSPVDVEIKWPGGEFGFWPQGTGTQTFPDGATFNRLEVRNPSLGTINVVLWLGGPAFNDSRSAIMEPKTVPLADPTTNLAALGSVSLTGIPSGDYIRRKAVLVTNLDANLVLQIRDAAGGVVATVFPRQTYTLPISEACDVHNPDGGAAVACNIAELWWSL